MKNVLRWLLGGSSVVRCSQVPVNQVLRELVLGRDSLTRNDKIFVDKAKRKDWPIADVVTELRARRQLEPLPASFDWSAYARREPNR